ncbi:MAG: hypothetical protein KAR06_04450 [Deltaproteobacteria bacterium]|nr:hypothetical protein [Deltaproteobacteria bacterium]
MTYKANGEVYDPNGTAASMRKLLSLASKRLSLDALKPSKLEEIMRVNELRKSCGVEPHGGKAITFRRYKNEIIERSIS